jgi:hypothetical protein
MHRTNRVDLKRALMLAEIKVLSAVVSMQDFPSARRF